MAMTQPFDRESITVSEHLIAEQKRHDTASRLLTEIARMLDAANPPVTCTDLACLMDDCTEDSITESYERLGEVAKQGDTWLAWIVPSVRTDTPSMKLNASVGIQREILRWASAYAPQLDALCDKYNLKFPFTPILRNRPEPVSPNNRTTERIIPAKVAMAPPEDRREGKMFSVAAHVEHGPEGQLVMPGFQHDRQAPALPLALYDLGLGSLEHRGRNPAAPLALRLWVASILRTQQQDRHGNQPVSLEIKLRELLAELYPGRKPRPNEYWPRLMKATETLGSPEARVPWYDNELGRGGQRHVVLVGDIPRGPGALDDHVQLIINLPPGSANGPQVSDNLALWGVRSDRAYRALLNLAYWWYHPGVTITPVGQRTDGQGRFWAQSQNPERYPNMSDNQLVQIVFPTSAKKHFRHLLSDAKKVLRVLQQAGELDIIDGKPIPPLKQPPPTTEQ